MQESVPASGCYCCGNEAVSKENKSITFSFIKMVTALLFHSLLHFARFNITMNGVFETVSLVIEILPGR
jgi:hypothetical protein